MNLSTDGHSQLGAGKAKQLSLANRSAFREDTHAFGDADLHGRAGRSGKAAYPLQG